MARTHNWHIALQDWEVSPDEDDERALRILRRGTSISLDAG
jgi:hypothetical protein